MIGREAKLAGFDAVAVTAPDAIPLAPARLKQFVAEGFHGSMGWIAETLERRADPRALWPEVRSIIVLAMNYGPDHDPRDVLEKRDRGAISVYAQNRDYHDIIKGRLKEIAGRIVARTGGDVKVFVDTAPVMEKPLAEAAGHRLAGQAHQSRQPRVRLVAVPRHRSSPLPRSSPMSRRRTIAARAAPASTPARPTPSRRPIGSMRGAASPTSPSRTRGRSRTNSAQAIGNRIYGCDDCLAACPWNKFARTASEAKLAARDDLREPKLAELLALDDAAFRALFSGSPVKRIGRDRFLRNVLIAAGNSGDPSWLPAAAHCSPMPRRWCAARPSGRCRG